MFDTKQLQRLQQQLDRLEEVYKLLANKLLALQKAHVIETDAEVKYRLSVQIEETEQAMKQLDRKIEENHQEISILHSTEDNGLEKSFCFADYSKLSAKAKGKNNASSTNFRMLPILVPVAVVGLAIFLLLSEIDKIPYNLNLVAPLTLKTPKPISSSSDISTPPKRISIPEMVGNANIPVPTSSTSQAKIPQLNSQIDPTSLPEKNVSFTIRSNTQLCKDRTGNTWVCPQ